MSFQDLTPAKALEYIRTQTSIFSENAQLGVREIAHEEGDGYVNHLYRIWDRQGKTVIIKQAKPYFSRFGQEAAIPVPVIRNRLEIDTYKIKSAIIPEYLIPILHTDTANHLFVQQYCTLPILRMQLCQGISFPALPQMLGNCIGKNAFYTSEFFLEQSMHKLLGAHFSNPGMCQIMEDLLFDIESSFGDPDENSRFLATHYNFVPTLKQDTKLIVEIMTLRDIYSKRPECLVHGDLHTSNIMISQNTLKIFDLEYTHMGAISSDIGYLCGNMLYPYIVWLFRHDKAKQEKDSFRKEILLYIEQTIEIFIETFKQCWYKDAKPYFKKTPQYIDTLFANLIAEVSGFMGTQLLMTTASRPGVFDFSTIDSEQNREKARLLSVLLGSSLIKYRTSFQTINQVLDTIRNVTEDFIKTSEKRRF